MICPVRDSPSVTAPLFHPHSNLALEFPLGTSASCASHRLTFFHCTWAQSFVSRQGDIVCLRGNAFLFCSLLSAQAPPGCYCSFMTAECALHTHTHSPLHLPLLRAWFWPQWVPRFENSTQQVLLTHTMYFLPPALLRLFSCLRCFFQQLFLFLPHQTASCNAPCWVRHLLWTPVVPGDTMVPDWLACPPH